MSVITSTSTHNNPFSYILCIHNYYNVSIALTGLEEGHNNNTDLKSYLNNLQIFSAFHREAIFFKSNLSEFILFYPIFVTIYTV